MNITRPVPFTGSPDEKRSNFNSHRWVTFDGEDYSCLECDVRTYHESANYPCGTEAPREVVEIG